jgi:hypothetical protein
VAIGETLEVRMQYGSGPPGHLCPPTAALTGVHRFCQEPGGGLNAPLKLLDMRSDQLKSLPPRFYRLLVRPLCALLF